MRRALFCSMVMVCLTPSLFASTTLYEEHFTNGVSSLNWFSAWSDSLGNPLTPMVPSNQAGPSDDWIGTVTGDLPSLGSLGSALTGNANLSDYSMEAQVYVDPNSGYYEGIMMRVDTTGNKVVGYQLASNFISSMGQQRLRFRYFSQIPSEIKVIKDFKGAEIPGGAPAVAGWHKMKIKGIGNQFWLYWDDQELPGCPYTDDTGSKGYFGTYVWDGMSGTAPVLKIDDIYVRSETQEVRYEEQFTGGVLALNWFSAWSDSLGNPLTPMVPSNEAGPSDDWIGTVTGDLPSLASLGSALAGSPDLSDYSMEAQVYVDPNSGYYEGIMVRVDTTGGKVVGYQLAANFNSSAMGSPQRIRFRYFSQIPAEIKVLRDFKATEIPGGAPTVAGWHEMKIKAVGNKFWLYWDGQELPGCPYTDDTLAKGYFGTYVWDGMSGVAPVLKIDEVEVQTETEIGVESDDDIANGQPGNFILHPNYPNPFNPETSISYQITRTNFVELTIYDMIGRKVKTLVSETQQPGFYTVIWDGRDNNLSTMPSGAYLYTLKTDGLTYTRKMSLVK